ncbi:MAG TPA: hypothetical protein VN132_05485, partial [Bdellovibrio sp.]|nr:hypothetical protein [Bdellovibrio sp.]
RFVTNLDPQVRKRIEYIEDPFPYEASAWFEAKELAPLAIDNQYAKVRWDELEKCPFDVIILKPAKMDVDKAIAQCKQWKLKTTVTSYMDHSVGIAHAMIVAMELKKEHGNMILESGCMTQRLYQKDAFTTEFETKGPFIQHVKGIGIGFDQLLEEMPWYHIKLR